MGVGSYVVAADSIEVRGTNERSLGVLTVETVGDLARTVRFNRADGSFYENEVTGTKLPIVDAPVENDLAGLVQTDPALRPFFAAHQLAFILSGKIAPQDAALAKTAKLKPDYYAYDCSNITFVSSCTKQWACDESDSNWSYAYDAYVQNGDDCATACYPYIAISQYPYWVTNTEDFYCSCYSGTAAKWDYAECPPAGNGCNTDMVKKTKTCSAPSGSCSTTSGFDHCAS